MTQERKQQDDPISPLTGKPVPLPLELIGFSDRGLVLHLSAASVADLRSLGTFLLEDVNEHLRRCVLARDAERAEEGERADREALAGEAGQAAMAEAEAFLSRFTPDAGAKPN